LKEKADLKEKEKADKAERVRAEKERKEQEKRDKKKKKKGSLSEDGATLPEGFRVSTNETPGVCVTDSKPAGDASLSNG
jgi:hypothetical protein